ncbi:unnamed protein product [Closterium sp. NIES-65]|nr:unnamed protein product [Closterium sp. NIES-65]
MLEPFRLSGEILADVAAAFDHARSTFACVEPTCPSDTTFTSAASAFPAAAVSPASVSPAAVSPAAVSPSRERLSSLLQPAAPPSGAPEQAHATADTLTTATASAAVKAGLAFSLSAPLQPAAAPSGAPERACATAASLSIAAASAAAGPTWRMVTAPPLQGLEGFTRAVREGVGGVASTAPPLLSLEEFTRAVRERIAMAGGGVGGGRVEGGRVGDGSVEGGSVRGGSVGGWSVGDGNAGGGSVGGRSVGGGSVGGGSVGGGNVGGVTTGCVTVMQPDAVAAGCEVSVVRKAFASDNDFKAFQAAPFPLSHLSQVGKAFASQYYTVMHTQPHDVHKFYVDESKFTRAERLGIPGETVTTMQGIHTKVMSLDSCEVKAEIKSVDCQESLSGGVLVVVTGAHCYSSSERRGFVQSFFLAPQQNGFYVLNDIFRFLEDAPPPQPPAVVKHAVGGGTKSAASASGSAAAAAAGGASQAGLSNGHAADQAAGSREVTSVDHAVRDVTVDEASQASAPAAAPSAAAGGAEAPPAADDGAAVEEVQVIREVPESVVSVDQGQGQGQGAGVGAAAAAAEGEKAEASVAPSAPLQAMRAQSAAASPAGASAGAASAPLSATPPAAAPLGAVAPRQPPLLPAAAVGGAGAFGGQEAAPSGAAAGFSAGLLAPAPGFAAAGGAAGAGEDTNAADEAAGEGRAVFVRNLPVRITAKEIAEHFNQFGAVKADRIQIRGNKANNPATVYAFVEFEEAAAALAAVEVSKRALGFVAEEVLVDGSCSVPLTSMYRRLTKRL